MTLQSAPLSLYEDPAYWKGEKGYREPGYAERLAYFAGFIDGEGSIGIWKRHHHRPYGQKGYIYYGIGLRVSNNAVAPLEALKATFGGSISVRLVPGGYHPSYTWSIQSALAYKALLALRPYLSTLRISASQGRADE